MSDLRKFTNHVNSDEFQAVCKANGWTVSVKDYVHGGDTIGFTFPEGMGVYDVTTGRAWGTNMPHTGVPYLWSTDSEDYQGADWFERIINAIYY